MAVETPCRAPVLLRSRNFQWYFNTAPKINLSCINETWEKYSDIENEIIEDAYNAKKNDVEIDGGYVISLKSLLQNNKLDDSDIRPIKRIQTDENSLGSRVSLRKERFFQSIPLASSMSPAEEDKNDKEDELHEAFIPYAYERLELENKNKTTTDVVVEAATGIMKTGIALGKEREAEWLAGQLLAVQKSGTNIQVTFIPDEKYAEAFTTGLWNQFIREECSSKVPPDIGETCVFLYTRDSFWYKHINSVLRNLETKTYEEVKTLGPFCWLLDQHLRWHPTRDIARRIYRGLDLSDEQRDAYLQENITLNAFTSTSGNRTLAEWYGNTLLIIDLMPTDGDLIDGTGIDISSLSNFPQEEEFLIRPGAYFEFVKQEYDSVNEKHIIYLKS